MNIGVIFAGGVGSRMKHGDKPKQFLEINGKAIIIHTIGIFERHPQIDSIVVVCVKDYIDYLKDLINKEGFKKVNCVLEGASSALGSQYIGLKAAKKIDKDGIVLIHDGVRPLIESDLITNCIECVKKNGNAITVSPATETIVTMKGEKEVIYDSMKRQECFYARAPQCFYVADIIKAHEKCIKKGKYDFVDSATMMLYFGENLYTVLSPAENIKVTTIADYYVCQAIIDKRKEIEG